MAGLTLNRFSDLIDAPIGQTLETDMRTGMAGRAGTVLAAAGLAAALVAGCGSEKGSSGGSNIATSKIINVSTTGTGVVANFNPYAAASSLVGTQGLIYEPLFYFNTVRSGDIQPQLGTAYSFADNGKTINVTTRQGVKWSDGQPFSAEDVAFTFTMIKNNAKLNLGSLPIISATAADATHVTLAFSQGMYTKLSNIVGGTAIVPKHIWSSLPDPAAYTNEKPVGTGPFMLTSVSQQNWVVERNPNYWEAGKPKIKGIRFIQFSGNDSVTAALAAGQIDWCGGFIQDIDKQFISKDRAHNHYINESQALITNLLPNLDKSVLADPAARKAVSQAINRDQLIKQAFAGYGKPVSVTELPVPLLNEYIKPEYQNSPLLTYNPQQAAQTLAQAGWAKGADGVYAKGGKRLSFTVMTVEGWSDYISALQIITQELKAAGIEMKTQQVSYPAFATAQQVGNFDTLITNTYSDDGTPYSFYARSFDSTRTAPVGKQADSNYGRFRDATVDQALRTIEQTAPDQKDAIKTQIMKIQDVVATQLPFIPLQQSSALVEYRTANVTGFPTEDNHYAFAAPFGWWGLGVVAKNLVPA
jgi:peptide/nickel transport system substrate-binding protein